MVKHCAAFLFALLWAWPCRAQTDVDSAASAAMDPAVALMDEAETLATWRDSALTKADWASVGDDTVEVRQTRFDTAAINMLRSDPDYDYDRTLNVQTLWWDRLMKWIGHWLNKLFGTKAGGWVFSHLHWAILIFAVAFLIFSLRKRLFHGVFAQEAGKARQVREIDEDIALLDLDDLLAKAERKGDWRSALRYQYLKVLRRLMEDGSIDFQPKSTDRDYLRQLKDPAQRAVFSDLSFLFKWAWYGDAPVDEARYRRLAPEFTAFHSARTNVQ